MSYSLVCVISVIMYFVIILLWIYLPGYLASNKVNQVGINHLNGDQTTGGIHFFEFHTPSGGIGLGTKLLFVAVIAILIAYFCLRRKLKKAINRASNQLPTVAPIVAPEATTLVHLANLLAEREIEPVHTNRTRRVGAMSEDR